MIREIDRVAVECNIPCIFGQTRWTLDLLTVMILDIHTSSTTASTSLFPEVQRASKYCLYCGWDFDIDTLNTTLLDRRSSTEPRRRARRVLIRAVNSALSISTVMRKKKVSTCVAATLILSRLSNA